MVTNVESHGRLVDPPSRASMWRYGFPGCRDYNDHEGFCGGFAVQWHLNGGRCGICGDAYSSPAPRTHELGGRCGQGILVREYHRGQVIIAKVQLTASHRGHFEFRICDISGRGADATQECLDRNVLKVLPEDGQKYQVGAESRVHKVTLKLPEDLTCEHCVLQWEYISGNNWGMCENGSSALGCGPQETFRSCADVAIVDSRDTQHGTVFTCPNNDDRCLTELFPILKNPFFAPTTFPPVQPELFGEDESTEEKPSTTYASVYQDTSPASTSSPATTSNPETLLVTTADAPTSVTTSNPDAVPDSTTAAIEESPTTVNPTSAANPPPSSTIFPPPPAVSSTSSPPESPPAASSTSSPPESPPAASSTSSPPESPPAASSTSSPPESPPAASSTSSPLESPPAASSTSSPPESPPAASSTSPPSESLPATPSTSPPEPPPTASSTSPPLVSSPVASSTSPPEPPPTASSTSPPLVSSPVASSTSPPEPPPASSFTSQPPSSEGTTMESSDVQPALDELEGTQDPSITCLEAVPAKMWENSPGMAHWCEVNCVLAALHYCPDSHCRCVKTAP